MTKAKKKLDDRFTREMTETVEGMRAAGVMDENGVPSPPGSGWLS
jgi:hypothetical protein